MRYLSLALGAVFVLSGCGVKGSCDRRASGSASCEEVLATSIKDMVQEKCTSDPNSKVRGTWAEKKACDHTTAIAGCETNLGRTWYYGGDRVSKPEHVKTLCSSGKVLDAKGKELKNLTEEKLENGVVTDPALDVVISSVRGPLEANAAGIERIRVPGSIAPIRLTGGKHVLAGPTVAAVYEEDLTNFANVKAPYRKDYPLKDTDDLHACGLALRAKERQGRADAEMARILKWCSQLTTLLVVKTSKLDAPVIRGVADFNTGLAIGNVYAYELPSGKAVGGYPFRAESSDKVKSSQLEADFFTNYAKALTTTLAKSDPGATYAFEVRATRN